MLDRVSKWWPLDFSTATAWHSDTWRQKFGLCQNVRNAVRCDRNKAQQKRLKVKNYSAYSGSLFVSPLWELVWEWVYGVHYTVLPATRQRWRFRRNPIRSWQSTYWTQRGERLSWPEPVDVNILLEDITWWLECSDGLEPGRLDSPDHESSKLHTEQPRHQLNR